MFVILQMKTAIYLAIGIALFACVVSADDSKKDDDRLV